MKTKWLLMMLMVVGLTAGAAQANMLANPGFEEGNFTGALDNFPPGWSFVSPSYTSAYTWLSGADAHSGTKYMRIQPWYASPSYNPSMYQSVTGVIEGKDYEFSAWAKNEVEDDTNQGTFYLDWSSAGGFISSNGVSFDVTSTEWTRLDFGTFTAPGGAIAATFWFSVTGYNPSASNVDDAGMFDTAFVRYPSPAIGEEVSTGDVVLSWTNADPNAPATSVYVDVWFGTDPNKPPLGSLVKVVDASENQTTVTVSAPTPGTYYWQVDTYRNGSPTGDPCEGEGPVWYFYTVADTPPSSVDAGVDMITWSGQPVPLDATVVDDGKSALTYAWSADPPDGVVFSDPAIEDPTVTINKGPYSNAQIANAGFEDEVIADGAWGAGDAPGWSSVGDNAGGGSWNPGLPGSDYPGYGGVAPEGSNIAYVGFNANSTGGGIAQILTETLAFGTTYELTVEVGDSPLYDWPGYKVQLLVDGNVLAEDDNSLTIPDNTFATSTVTYTSVDASDPNIGLPLEIRLLVVNSSATGWLEMNFDDVRLTANPPFPTRTGVSTVELTLAVSDAVGSATDSMKIDVYDDACQAARIGFSRAAENPGDLDGDCDTDLKDLSLQLSKWLDFTGLTEAFEIIP